MPDTYLPGEHDLVGVITGIVDKDKIITGENISPGDVLVGLPSNGLHTNGYSLARKIFFKDMGYDVDTYLESLNNTVGAALLEPHINYTNHVFKLLNEKINVKGIAHITGGGLKENIPRILPNGCSVKIQKGMIISNEPGYYKKDKFGIRIENLVYVKKIGRKLGFENLTLAPIEKELINFNLLTKQEKNYLFNYHLKVYSKISPFLNRNEKNG